ncbi:hypothetical protein Poli38472_011902 [Pythium oligandrum]|uniref:NFX1-type zinc finger-containing protein 1 n=1 Tax=Pythium oligandrum TaxID=41045 RepID=A0A8K1C7X4_PYTOL|nr:hypothetical protein Poli38472_011902 [Pythium oligandrum]|eukprot:TMW58314.1 hypothetical protein Poli38472_011902 [Pythium oligandrum]
MMQAPGRKKQSAVCRHFAQGGNCRFGSTCRFVHAVDGGGGSRKDSTRRQLDAPTPSTTTTSSFSLAELRRVLTEQLHRDLVMNAHASDALVVLWDKHPDGYKQDVRWKPFLLVETTAKPRTLTTSNDAMIFVNSALQALRSPSVAPEFIRALGERGGMGVEILERFVRFEYSESAGRKRDVVSFQRGLVPFLMLLTSKRLDQAARLNVQAANYVYSCVVEHRQELFGKYIERLAQVVYHGNIEDIHLSHERFLQDSFGTQFAPLCFSQLVLPFLILLELLANKFREVAYDELFPRTVKKVGELVLEWIVDHEPDDLDSAHCFQLIQKAIDRLLAISTRSAVAMRAGQAMAARQQRNAQGVHAVDPVEQQWNLMPVVPPGEALMDNGAFGPRHDNDKMEIKEISILPTTSEVFSPHTPALPGNFAFLDGAHWLPPGPERWIDTHFRLFREDMCQILRESLQDLAGRFENSKRFNVGRVKGEKVDFSLYQISQYGLVMLHTGSDVKGGYKLRQGLCVDLEFPLSTLGTKFKERDRAQFWDRSGRLRRDSMVAVVSYASGSLEVVFSKVVVREIANLVKDPAKISVQPYSSADLKVVRTWQQVGASIFLVELNKLFFDSYEPVLKALQEVSAFDIPFLDHLAPVVPMQGGRMDVPQYCLQPGFRFDLSPCLKGNRRVHLEPDDVQSRALCVQNLVRESTLEKDQAEAVVGALCSQVACIQGLPGSGKSFIGNLITQVILKANVTPILVVCYTNHALDQFLCHLLDSGINKIVRIGGQSKEPRLEPYNLSKLEKPPHGRELYYLYSQLDEAAEDLNYVYNELSGKITWRRMRNFLEDEYPNCYQQFVERDDQLFDDGWNVAGCDNVLDYWLDGIDNPPPRRGRQRNVDLHRGDIWSWSVPERKQVYAYWQRELLAGREDEVVKAQKKYDRILTELNGVRNRADADALQNAQVIGMTTTGVAKHRQKIAAVNPKVVICEEAGEVLEAQLMACLTPSCQQMILIGDHQQLRPHIAVYDLSVESRRGQKYRLDVSMFERLVSQDSGTGVPMWTLTEQHRMRPQISQFVRTLFYPRLRDAAETEVYESVKGIDKNVFFVNHTCPEDGAAAKDQQMAGSIRSHSNALEVQYVVATLRYLLQQNYQTSDIAILTPYVSQLLAIREALRGEFVIQLSELDEAEVKQELAEDELAEQLSDTRAKMQGATQTQLSKAIRLATVDNFQGEEAKIILVSLVRSTIQKGEEGRSTIGFLKIPNRINVLLSRAMHGMYLVGHGALLREKSEHWRKVIEILEEDECIGDGLPIHCQKHPDDHRVVRLPKDFKVEAPHGGCLRPCGLRLPNCGHICQLMCHSDQPTHETVYCDKPCARLHNGCGHLCPKNCGDKCGRCETVVGNITLPCGHGHSNTKCWEALSPSKVYCRTPVEKVVPECGHTVKVQCGDTKLVCKQRCGTPLSCGHECRRECADCTRSTVKAMNEHSERIITPITRTEHGACQKECGRVLSCAHRCQGVCHPRTPCPPCSSRCDIFQCVHGGCAHKCSTMCSACCETCEWECEHQGRCELPCGSPCIRRLCDERCSRILDCGHRCPSICGEACPSVDFCHVCADADKKQKQVDLIMFQSYEEVDPDEDPIVVLPCCRVMYTKDSMDGVVGISRAYSPEGLPTALPSELIAMPQCPNCNRPIRGINRYNRVTKRAAIDAAEKKFIESSQRALVELQSRLQLMLTKKEAEKDKAFVKAVQKFARDTKRPPCQKAFEACVAALERSGQSMAQELLPVPNSKFQYGGYSNLLLAHYYLRIENVKDAEAFAHMAITRFVDGGFSIQLRETRLVLTQALLLKAREVLTNVKEIEGRVDAIDSICEEVEAQLHELPSGYQAAVVNGVVEETRAMRLRARGPFYEEVTEDERRSVLVAMQVEFRGTGHWYRCPNGHPYSVGECGMPMQESSCPECGAVVGGSDHTPAAGNLHYNAIERL